MGKKQATLTRSAKLNRGTVLDDFARKRQNDYQQVYKLEAQIASLKSKKQKLVEDLRDRWLTLTLARTLSIPLAGYHLLEKLKSKGELEADVTWTASDSPEYWLYDIDVVFGDWQARGVISHGGNNIEWEHKHQLIKPDFDTGWDEQKWYLVFFPELQYLSPPPPLDNDDDRERKTRLAKSLSGLFKSKKVEESWFDLETNHVDMTKVLFFLFMDHIRCMTGDEVPDQPWYFAYKQK
jgi:hypothetical protein